MVYGCGARTLKCLVFFFNLLAFAAGLALLITCIIAYTDPTVQGDILGQLQKLGVTDIGKAQSTNTILIVGMVLGGIIMILGFLGCFGACSENPCMLITFAVILLVIILIQVGIAVAVLVYKTDEKNMFEKAVVDAFARTKLPDEDVQKEPACNWFHDLNEHLKCCGVDGDVRGSNCKKPLHCAKGTRPDPDDTSKLLGCKAEVWNAFWSRAKAFGLVGLVMVILEIAAIVFACLLIYAMNKGRRLYERV